MLKCNAITFLIIFCLFFTSAYGQINESTVSFSTKDSIERVEIDSLRRLVIDTYFEKDYGRTIEIGKNAILRADSINYYDPLFSINSYLGNAFLAIQDTLQAKRTFSETLELAESIKDSSALIMNSIDLGNVYLLQKNSEKALELYKNTIPIAEKRLKNRQLNPEQKELLLDNLFVLNYNIAEIYLLENNKDNARKFVKATKNYYSDTLYAGYKAGYHYIEGRLSSLENNPIKALQSFTISETLARSIGFTDLLIDISLARIEDEMKLGNLDVALDLRKEVDSLKSEKYKADRIIAVETATAKFKLDQYEKDLKTQELQNEIDQQNARKEATQLWILIASLILLIASAILLVSYLKRKKLLKNLQSKNKQYLAEKEKTEALSKAKTILFSNIAHELRTPAYGIVGLTDSIQRPEEKENFNENIQALQYSAYYLRSLINNILLFNKVDEMDDYELDDFEFNVREVVANAVESSKHLNQIEPNEYKIKIDKDIPQILRGDEVKLSQILINLISNSTKFTTRGIISISALLDSKNDQSITIKFIIRDTGKGIEESLIPHLFNEFNEASTHHTTSGYRLGLPIVKKLLDYHGATVNLSSKVNEGTELSFNLEYAIVTQDLIKQSTVNKVESDSEKPFLGKRFLVVDDNKINLLVTQKTISRLGGESVLADSGQEAIRSAKESNFDLIFMDINMPEMDGFEASEHIRAFDKTTPIVALTAVDLHTISERNRSGLLNNFIIKPYPLEDLIATVQECLYQTT